MKPSGIKLEILTDEAPINTGPSIQGAGPTADIRSVVIDLDVVSDVICPWCWVGKRRLQKAIALLGPNAKVTVTWRPFQLNPSMPKQGMDRRRYIEAKFGSIERFQGMEDRLVAVGATEGIDFRFDRITRIPNTLDSHRLIWLAQQYGKQDSVVESLFKAYFENGTDIGDRRNLVALAESAGIDGTVVEKLFLTDEGLQAVLSEEDDFKSLGIDGVPSFVVGGMVLFSGAAEPKLMAEEFRQAAYH